MEQKFDGLDGIRLDLSRAKAGELPPLEQELTLAELACDASEQAQQLLAELKDVLAAVPQISNRDYMAQQAIHAGGQLLFYYDDPQGSMVTLEKTPSGYEVQAFQCADDARINAVAQTVQNELHQWWTTQGHPLPDAMAYEQIPPLPVRSFHSVEDAVAGLLGLLREPEHLQT